jgi:hypothetical protein
MQFINPLTPIRVMSQQVTKFSRDGIEGLLLGQSDRDIYAVTCTILVGIFWALGTVFIPAHIIWGTSDPGLNLLVPGTLVASLIIATVVSGWLAGRHGTEPMTWHEIILMASGVPCAVAICLLATLICVLISIPVYAVAWIGTRLRGIGTGIARRGTAPDMPRCVVVSESNRPDRIFD